MENTDGHMHFDVHVASMYTWKHFTDKNKRSCCDKSSRLTRCSPPETSGTVAEPWGGSKLRPGIHEDTVEWAHTARPFPGGRLDLRLVHRLIASFGRFMAGSLCWVRVVVHIVAWWCRWLAAALMGEEPEGNEEGLFCSIFNCGPNERKIFREKVNTSLMSEKKGQTGWGHFKGSCKSENYWLQLRYGEQYLRTYKAFILARWT